jgi:hypothetical protein
MRGPKFQLYYIKYTTRTVALLVEDTGAQNKMNNDGFQYMSKREDEENDECSIFGPSSINSWASTRDEQETCYVVFRLGPEPENGPLPPPSRYMSKKK